MILPGASLFSPPAAWIDDSPRNLLVKEKLSENPTYEEPCVSQNHMEFSKQELFV